MGILRRALTMVAVSASMGAIVATSPAAAEPRVTETVEHYDVSGTSPLELRKALNQVGPVDKTEGRRFDAVTNWFVNWRYTYQNTGQGCAIASATTDVKVNIIMPRLKADGATPPAMRQAFDTYTSNLLVHEKGHGKIGIDIARRIEDGIAKLPAEPNCDRMGQVANQLGQALIKEANKQDIEYDAKTDHGATQGARYP
jgi:predicted secreted Zn-dependent protease